MPIRRYLWIAISLVLPVALTVISLTRGRSAHGPVVEVVEEEPTTTGARPEGTADHAPSGSDAGPDDAGPDDAVGEPDAGPRP